MLEQFLRNQNQNGAWGLVSGLAQQSCCGECHSPAQEAGGLASGHKGLRTLGSYQQQQVPGLQEAGTDSRMADSAMSHKPTIRTALGWLRSQPQRVMSHKTKVNREKLLGVYQDKAQWPETAINPLTQPQA